MHPSVITAAAVSSAPPPEMPVWSFPACLVFAAAAWWMHWRWRRGLRFHIGRVKSDRDLRQVAAAGFPMLPAAVTGTAATVAVGVWNLFLPFGNVLFAYIFVAAVAVAVLSGGWAFKERYWPSRGRTPQWIRDLGLEP